MVKGTWDGRQALKLVLRLAKEKFLHEYSPTALPAIALSLVSAIPISFCHNSHKNRRVQSKFLKMWLRDPIVHS